MRGKGYRIATGGYVTVKAPTPDRLQPWRKLLGRDWSTRLLRFGLFCLAMIPFVIVVAGSRKWPGSVIPWSYTDLIWPRPGRSNGTATFWLLMAGAAFGLRPLIASGFFKSSAWRRPEWLCVGMAGLVFFGPPFVGFRSGAGDMVTSFGWRDLIWPTFGMPIAAAEAWLVIAGGIWILRRQFRSAGPFASPSRGAATITVFGQQVARPVFLDRGRGVFTWRRPTIHYTDGRGQAQMADIRFMSGRTARNEILRLESLVESARLEQEKRGHRTTDLAGRPAFPELTDQGVLVEIGEDNGKTLAVVAVGFGRELLPAEYQEARNLGIGHPRGAWASDAPSSFRYHNPKEPPLIWTKAPAPVMALFKVELRTVEVPDDRPQADPLAPPSVEKGGARFAWPIPPEGPPA